MKGNFPLIQEIIDTKKFNFTKQFAKKSVSKLSHILEYKYSLKFFEYNMRFIKALQTTSKCPKTSSEQNKTFIVIIE